MKESFRSVLISLAVLGIMYIVINTPINGYVTKNNYCHIDSVSLGSISKYSVLPEQTYKYHTDCGNSFSAKKQYSLGDSINIKTIYVENR